MRRVKQNLIALVKVTALSGVTFLFSILLVAFSINSNEKVSFQDKVKWSFMLHTLQLSYDQRPFISNSKITKSFVYPDMRDESVE